MTKIVGAPTLDDALRCLAECVAEGEARGERNLIFCEDRLTLLAERALLNASGGTFLTEVTTFARFLNDNVRVLSKQGSAMAVTALIAELGEELQCFGKGSAEAVYETLAQLSASRVDPAALRLAAEQTDGMLQGKLFDLARLGEAYAGFLASRGFVDENGYLALLPERIAREELGGVNVVFFAFPSFTRQAREGVAAALESAKSVTGIFVAGRADLYTNEGAHIFRTLCEQFGETEVSLTKNTLTGDALVLQNGLFSPERYFLPPQRAQSVYLFSAADEESELSTVAALIKKYAFEGLRYRDIAVLAPDKESFRTVEKVFSAYRIPFFADKKRPFSEHPFCRFLLDVLCAVSDGFLPDEADAVASSVYFGDGDVYRNYLLKYGAYRGAVRREIRPEIAGDDRETLCACRERILKIFSLFPKKGRADAYISAVKDLLSVTDAEAVTEGLQAQLEGAEREFLSLSPLQGVLTEMEAISTGRRLTAREFYDMLLCGLSALEISLIPQSADAVFVGDCTESKFARVKALFATGLTEKVPRVSPDTAVISDREINRLSALQVEIEPAIAQVNARARESLALNLCAFTQALYLSYPARQGGQECDKGEVIRYCEQLFELRPIPDLFPYDCCEFAPAAVKLVSLKREFEEGRRTREQKYSALYAALAEAEGESAVQHLYAGEKLPVPQAERLYFSGAVSPTLLEQYFACPYAGFATRGLRLFEREERAVLDTDSGTFVHRVLDEVAKRLNAISTEEECRKIAEEIGAEELTSPRFAALSDTAAGAYTAKRLLREGAEVSAAAFRQLKQSAFRVAGSEQKIAIGELSLEGKVDRIDVSGDYVRIIDYKTGSIDDRVSSYYMGSKLQLQLYLRAAAAGKRPAGAFYFPAAFEYAKADEAPYRMLGFFNGEDGVMQLLDGQLQQGEKSLLFEGTRNGKFSDKGMSEEDFNAFLDYGILVSRRAIVEMKNGNIAPSPREGACDYCKLKGMCAFVGEPRAVQSCKCADIVELVRRERGERE